jgi:hypothetical protein
VELAAKGAKLADKTVADNTFVVVFLYLRNAFGAYYYVYGLNNAVDDKCQLNDLFLY